MLRIVYLVNQFMCKDLFQKRAYVFWMEAIPMCPGTVRIRQYPSNTTNLSIIKLATCFDSIGLSSGLHYEPINVKILRTSLGFQ